ncbi:hypothetical protein C8F01DRAFT_1242432 [Mycena amicta]|nr:hypothetical protein C8F01DRAFT_1242432 [Mycena amicta]
MPSLIDSDSIHAFFRTLRTASFDIKTLSDPSKCTEIVFPSLLRTSIYTTGQHELIYKHVGVPVVEQILIQMEKIAHAIHPRVSGHCWVLFLPDSSLVAEDPIFWLKLVFALSFADVPQTVHRIMTLTTVEDFIELARESREDVYLLVDGFDRLNDELKAFVRAAAGSHSLIYTSYAVDSNVASGRDSAWIRIPSGFSPAEYTHWLNHFKDQIPSPMIEPYHSYIEYFTGTVPALLQPLFNYPASRVVDAVTMYRMSFPFEHLTDEITKFVTQSETWSKAEQARFYELMTACLTETLPEVRPGANTALWDPRFFYFDQDGKGHTVCGIARDTVIDFLRGVDMALFTTDAWYTCVRSPKVSMRCQAITQICLTRICSGGLSQADAQGGAMQIHTFRQTLSFGWMFEEAWKTPQGMSSFLCIPGLEVCRFLAAVIVRISPRDKMAHLIPLQITTNNVCTDLATPFFAVAWHKWELAIRDEGFNVVNTFACVDSLMEESEEVWRLSIEHREKVKFISPAYTMRNLNVAQLDPKLGRILRPERNLTSNLEKRLP